MRAKTIKNSPKVNAELSSLELKALVKRLQSEMIGLQSYVRSLEKELGSWRLGKIVPNDRQVSLSTSLDEVNPEKIQFMDDLVQKIGETKNLYNCQTVILAGDLNIVFKDCDVKNRAFTSTERRVAGSIKDSLDSLDLTDGWDQVAKSFTWTSCRNGRQIFSILDRIMYTKGTLILKAKTNYIL